MSAKERNLLIVLAGVLLLILSYFFVYKPKIEENQTIMAENDTLSARVTELKSLIENQPFYEGEIARIDADVKKMLTDYPSWLMYENGIMDVVDLEHFTNTEISTLTVGVPMYVSIGATVSENASAEAADTTDTTAVSAAASKYQLFDVQTNVVYSSSYEDTKNLINMIAQADDKRSIQNFSATYDATTGLLTGTIDFDSYFIVGQDEKAYVPANIPPLTHGVDNIFGTIELIPETSVEATTEGVTQ